MAATVNMTVMTMYTKSVTLTCNTLQVIYLLHTCTQTWLTTHKYVLSEKIVMGKAQKINLIFFDVHISGDKSMIPT